MPAPAHPLSPPSGPQAVIAIPGASPSPTNRRSATNPHARLSAYVVRDPNLDDAPPCAITVAIKARTRLLGLSLRGHAAPIVDLEFLPTTPDSRLHVLGSCDQHGIVYLWFLYVERDALGIDKSLNLLRDYSFFTLRKSTAAFYSRIRLAGSPENGTMVLVPNDGSNVRVVTFHCEPNEDPNAKPNVPVIAPPPEVKALPPPESQPPLDQSLPEDPVPDAPPAPHIPAMPQHTGAVEDEEFVDALGSADLPQGERPIDVARTAANPVDDNLDHPDPAYDRDADVHHLRDAEQPIVPDHEDQEQQLTNGMDPIPA